MRLNSVSAEPPHLICLIPEHSEADQVAIYKGINGSQDEPHLVEDAPFIEASDSRAHDVSKRSHKEMLAIMAAVVVAHLLLFWALHQHPTKQEFHEPRGQVYHAALASLPSAPPQVNTTGIEHVVPEEQKAQKARKEPDVVKATPGKVRPSRLQTHKPTQTTRQKSTANTRHHTARGTSRPHAASGHAPSAQSLIQQTVSTATQAGWQQAADRFAEGDSSNSQRNAIDRYIAYFTRAVQTYIDLNLGAESVANAEMQIGITVGRNGRLEDVRVLKSTGYKELDQLAVKTIHRAGPFRPFDSEMGNIPDLTFSRGWLFGHGGYFRFR